MGLAVALGFVAGAVAHIGMVHSNENSKDCMEDRIRSTFYGRIKSNGLLFYDIRRFQRGVKIRNERIRRSGTI